MREPLLVLSDGKLPLQKVPMYLKLEESIREILFKVSFVIERLKTGTR